jgi:hypothetical protein
MILGQTVQQDVVGLGQLWVVQQVRLRDGEQQLHKSVERIVQGLVAVQAKHAEVDVAAAQRRLQHRETDGDAFEQRE